MAFFRSRAVNLLNLHYGIHAIALSGGGAFFAVYLLKSGVSIPWVLASLALILAHADLESITLERDLMREKARLEPRYAELVYDGLWYSPLKRALDVWGDPGSSIGLMRALKAKLDPHNTLNPGRYVGGI